jgi:hypothetical protein
MIYYCMLPNSIYGANVTQVQAQYVGYPQAKILTFITNSSVLTVNDDVSAVQCISIVCCYS